MPISMPSKCLSEAVIPSQAQLSLDEQLLMDLSNSLPVDGDPPREFGVGPHVTLDLFSEFVSWFRGR